MPKLPPTRSIGHAMAAPALDKQVGLPALLPPSGSRRLVARNAFCAKQYRGVFRNPLAQAAPIVNDDNAA
eukprot:5370552-Alexandrium_andersonii.AAC.1